MAETFSSMLPLKTKAPHFKLQDTISDQYIALDEVKSEVATVIMFLCNHCPYVKHISLKLIEVASLYKNKGISFIAINSNDIKEYPSDSPEKMREVALKNNFSFPYLFDETQEIAKAYHAACTPDFYIFDKNLECVYRGRFDNSRPLNNIPPSGKDLIEALENILANKPINPDQKASVGCNIKWK